MTVVDPSGSSTVVTIRVRVVGVNDGPKVDLGTTSAAYTEDGPHADLAPSLTLTDVDDATISAATVTIADGEGSDLLTWTVPTGSGITASYDSATQTLAASGSASKTAYRDLLRSVAFHTVSDTPDESPRTVTFTVADPADNDGADDLTLAVTAHDDPSSAVDDTKTVAEDSGSTAIDVLANDVDPDGNGPEVTSVGQPEDGSVTRVDGDVSYTPAANFNGSTSFTYTLVGGSTATVTVTVTAVNDAPTLAGGTGSASTAGGATGVIVHDAITVDDVDSSTLAGATVSIGAGFDATEDRLSFTDTATITGTYNTSTGVLTLVGNGTTAAYQTALRSVLYRNLGSGGPSPATRVIGFRVTDGSASDATSNTVISNVTIAAANVAPSLSGAGALEYTENDTATAISPALVLTDVDNPTLTGATASITGNLSAGQDRLSFTNAAPITGSYNASTGVLTLSGTATVAEYQAALRAVKYHNTSDTPSTVTRTVTYSVSDGELSDSDTATVTVTAVNDAPVADDESFSGADAAIGNTTLVGDDSTDGAPNPAGPQKIISANILGGDTDAEGDSLAVVPGTFATNDGGSVTVQADGDFTFTPATGTSCSDASDFFDYTVTDGASPTPGTDTGRVTIAITDCVWYVDNTANAGGNGTSGEPFDTLAEADSAATTTGAYLYVYEGDGTTAGLTGGVALLANQRLVGAAEDLTVAGATLENGSDTNRPAISGNVTLAAGNTVEGLAIATSGANAIDGGAGDASGTLDDLVLTPSGAAGSGITLNGTSGTWNVSDTTITATAGAQGIVLSGAGTVNFTSAGTLSITAAGPAFSALSTAVSGVIDTTTSTGGSYGWALNAVTGSIDLGTGTVSGHTSTEVSVTAGTGDVTYAGTIGNGTGTSAIVQNRTTGAVTLSGNINDSSDAGGGISMSGNSGGSTTFSGTSKTLNTGSSTAVNLAFSGGHTVSFTGGGLDIDTTSGSGITSSSPNGFVAVTGSGNTIDVSSGTSGTKGLNLNGPDITASGLTFQRISTTASDNGIVLVNTGSAGGLTVTGTGTSGSGGVITTSTGAGISLTSTRDIALSGVNVTNGGDDGIRASNVTNLSLAGNAGTGLASAISGNGNAGGENGFDLTELAGVVTISNATVTGNYDNNVALFNDAATLSNFTIDDGSYGSTSRRAATTASRS
ncbi:beta strand repeat-containing protein [Aeromicrobium sp. UC242_57]|uniref:beta strand repeat-containing protein n=1 Tax=Aeromicrobium sp. UC242_57 TaxID=3374624 RepID=UPI0037B280DC